MDWMTWYNGLAKPSWTPSPPTIGLIWQILYPIIIATFGFVFVQALAELNETRGIAPAMELAAYGAPCRSRPAGIQALGRLGRIEWQKDKVRKVLVGLLSDRNDYLVSKTIDALTELADLQAIPALEALANSSAFPWVRQHARTAIGAIGKERGESEALRALRERVEKLEKAREDMEKRLATTQPTASEGGPKAISRPLAKRALDEAFTCAARRKTLRIAGRGRRRGPVWLS